MYAEHLVSYQATVSVNVHEATVAITTNPWQPALQQLHWFARLIGAWVVAPTVYMGLASGPALKFMPSLQTKRSVWVSDNFKTSHPALWLLILELATRLGGDCKWKFLGSAHDFAASKARALARKQGATVVALVTDAEAATNPLQHVFDPEAFLSFVGKVDRARTSLGLGEH